MNKKEIPHKMSLAQWKKNKEDYDLLINLGVERLAKRYIHRMDSVKSVILFYYFIGMVLGVLGTLLVSLC